MDDYRFINIDQEPSEEQLAQLMHEMAVEAKERHDRAHAAYFEQIHQMAQAYEKTRIFTNEAVCRISAMN